METACVIFGCKDSIADSYNSKYDVMYVIE